MAGSNPNGANQFLSDPRQKLCWDYYIDPRSETFSNGTKSAIKAGYDPEYAAQITTIEWFLVKLRRLNMLNKAEKVLDKTLDNKEDLKLAQDTAKFIAKTLGKNDGYSDRLELTGSEGKDLFLPSEEEKKLADEALKSLNDTRGKEATS